MGHDPTKSMWQAAVCCVVALAATAIAYTDDPLMAPYWERVDKDRQCAHETACGFRGITKAGCNEMGCCFDPDSAKGMLGEWCTGIPSLCASDTDCSNQGTCSATGSCICDQAHTGHACKQTVIRKVHLVQSCHLDVGFTDTSAGVINRYQSHHIPAAIAAADSLRNNSNGWRVRFMAQS